MTIATPEVGVRADAPQPGTAPGFELRGQPTPPAALLRELWQARALLAILARKDFFVRYRRASLGLLWAVGLPLIQAVVLAVVFSRILSFHSESSYPVLVFSGLVAFTFFQTAVTTGSTAIVDGAALSSKIYFPRALLPLVAVATSIYPLMISVVLLLGMAAVLGAPFGAHTLYLVPAVVAVVLAATAVVLLTSALHVYFRDVRYLVQAVLFPLLYATPVIYPLRALPHTLRIVVLANPLTGLVELFRAGTVGADAHWGTAVAVSAVWFAALGLAGLALQCRFNRVFADLL